MGRKHQPNHSNNIEAIALRYWHLSSPANGGQQTTFSNAPAPAVKTPEIFSQMPSGHFKANEVFTTRARREEPTDAQWILLELLILETMRCVDGKGRPERHSNRSVMSSMLWWLRTGVTWADLPECFPSGSTCDHRFSRWMKAGGFHQILGPLAGDLEERGRLDLPECFIGACLRSQKRGPKVGRARRGKGQMHLVMAVAHGLPLAVRTASTSLQKIILRSERR